MANLLHGNLPRRFSNPYFEISNTLSFLSTGYGAYFLGKTVKFASSKTGRTKFHN
jgi:hypothetical protein